MNTKEKVEIIQSAAQEALELIAQARELLEGAQEETGYNFDYTIMQELEEGRMNGLASELVNIADGSKDKSITAEIGEEEEEEN